MFLTGADSFKKFARFIVYVFIFTFPFILYEGYLFGGTSTRATNLIILVDILIIIFGCILFRKKSNLIILKSPITTSLVVFFLVLFVSSILGVDFSTSFWSKVTRTTGLFYFLHLGVFYFLFLALFKEENSLRTFLKVFLISAGIFSICSVLSSGGFGLFYNNKPWGGFTFANSTFAAMYMYAAFMASLYFLISTPKDLRRFWHKLIPVLLVLNPYFINWDIFRGKADLGISLLNIIGGAKASTYALIFSVIALGVIWGIAKIKSTKIRRSIIWVSIPVGLAVITLAIVSFFSTGGFINKFYLEQATSARPIVWSLSAKAIKERPVFGYGVDNFDYVFERYYDNKIMETKNGAEAWFDRAHNIFLDQAIETGYLGLGIYLLVYLTIIGSMIYILLKTSDGKHQSLAMITIVYFLGHLAEIQTAFDTTISYVPLVLMAVLATLLFHQVYSSKNPGKTEIVVGKNIKYVLAVLAIGIFGTMFFIGTVPMTKSQITNGAIRRVGSSEKRLPMYGILFNSPIDKAGVLSRTVVDLERGVSLSPNIVEDQVKSVEFNKELDVLVEQYKSYLEEHPDEYRTSISFANLLIYQRLFDVDHLDEAHDQLEKAIILVPQAPQAYWMNSVAYLYQRKFSLAKEFAQKAYNLNKNIEESQRLLEYIEDSIKTFPVINLYNFRMI